MTGYAGGARRGRRSGWRALGWGAAVLLLLAPFVAMQVTDEVRWGPLDFAVAGVLIGGAGLLFELAVRASASRAYRAAAALAVLTAFLLIWSNLAVGVIGDEDDPANLMFAGVLAVAGVGGIAVRFRARGLALVLAATAGVQALVGAVALAMRWGSEGPAWPWDVAGASAAFTCMWLAAAGLFALAAREG